MENINIGDKIQHIKTNRVETVIDFCKIKINGVWFEGVIYEGIDYKTNEIQKFVRTKENFCKNFKLIKE